MCTGRDLLCKNFFFGFRPMLKVIPIQQKEQKSASPIIHDVNNKILTNFAKTNMYNVQNTQTS